MTLREQFESLKHNGYVCDADDLPPREWADGKMHEKKGGEWFVVGSGTQKQEKKQTEKEHYEFASTVPWEKKVQRRFALAEKLKNDVERGTIENSTIGTTKISKHSVGKLASDKALDKSMANGFSADEHFDAAERVVDLYKNAKLKETKPDDEGDPNIASIKRFEQPFTTCDNHKARAWITVKESTYHGHRLYSIEVMELEKAGKTPAGVSGAELNQSDATVNIAHDHAEVKSLRDIYNRIKGL